METASTWSVQQPPRSPSRSDVIIIHHEIIDEKKRRFSKCRLSISVRSSFFCGAVFSCLYVRPNLVVCSLSSTAAWAPGMTSARPTSDTRGWHRPADREHPSQIQRWGWCDHHVIMMVCDAGKVSDTGGHPHGGGAMSRQGELLSPGLTGNPGQWTEGPLPHCQVRQTKWSLNSVLIKQVDK